MEPNEEFIASALKALGEPTRLAIFDFLRCCDCQVALDAGGAARPVRGLTVGEVCCQVLGDSKIPSRMTHHLKELRHAGLIRVERQGRHMICSVVPEAIEALRKWLNAQPCCARGEHK